MMTSVRSTIDLLHSAHHAIALLQEYVEVVKTVPLTFGWDEWLAFFCDQQEPWPSHFSADADIILRKQGGYLNIYDLDNLYILREFLPDFVKKLRGFKFISIEGQGTYYIHGVEFYDHYSLPYEEGNDFSIMSSNQLKMGLRFNLSSVPHCDIEIDDDNEIFVYKPPSDWIFGPFHMWQPSVLPNGPYRDLIASARFGHFSMRE